MKISSTVLFSVFILTSFLFSRDISGTELSPEDLAFWNKPLVMSGGGYWKKRMDFKITNKTKNPWEEKTIDLPISGSPESMKKGSLPLVGVQASQIRLCDLKGKELVFNILDHKGEEFHYGSIGEGFTFSVPVNCESEKTVSFSLYYDNSQSWTVPDWLPIKKGLSNTGFEQGTHAPEFWILDKNDANHRISWSNDNPQAGKKCIKVVVDPNAKSSWIAARQQSIPLVPGGKYLFTAYVRGEDVKGNCGWYFHIGTRDNPMKHFRHIKSSQGTFDWKQITEEFIVPEDATHLSLGTMLYGTGTAWFDSVDLKRIDAKESNAHLFDLSVDPPKTTPYKTWYPSSKGEFGSSTFDASTLVPNNTRYTLLCCRNDALQASKKKIMFDAKMIELRWGKKLTPENCRLIDLNNRPVKVNFWNNYFFIDVELKDLSWNHLLLIDLENNDPISSDSKEIAPVATMQYTNGAFPGTSMQGDQEEKKILSTYEPVPDFIQKNNLVENGNMESGMDSWSHDQKENGVEYNLIDPGLDFLGKKAIEMKVGENVKSRWRGFRKTIKVNPGSKYFCGYWISTDSPAGNYQIHVHQHTAKGALSSGGMGTVGSSVGGKTDWTLQTGYINTAPDTESIQLHFTSTSTGIVRFDDVFLIEMETATFSTTGGGISGVFQVPGIVKVFPDTTFVSKDPLISPKNPASIFLAKNESESMQIALRTKKDTCYSLRMTEPVLKGDPKKKLAVPEMNAVGYVLIDITSGYYRDEGPACYRRMPGSASHSDGWSGLWPDPLIPLAPTDRKPDLSVDSLFKGIDGKNDSFKLASLSKYGIVHLEAEKTRALWLLFKTDAQTEPGIYEGSIELDPLTEGEKILVPYTVEVLNFTLPDRPNCLAIYDARIAKNYFDTGSSAEAAEQVREFLVSKKIAPDRMRISPNLKYDRKTETVQADWTEFDRCASKYFDEWGIRYTYLPGAFYLFGWGLPPKKNENVDPYPGEYPYKGADRLKLDPKYKKIYQAKLKLIWDHLKEKGWSDRFVLYISDEPFYSQKNIIDQMKALCAMIHEVDPKIPIYSSTWHYVPEWDGSLDVWGIGHYGIVSREQIQTIKNNGGRIWWTTDGQMCLDTPYCAVERLLPWWCIQYGAEAYEFWGVSWYTYNPFDYGSHVYIPQSDRPGVHYYIRYPNGDGYLVYPGRAIGLDQCVISSIRLEQAREGVEDADWFVLLKEKMQKEKRPSLLKTQKDLMKEVGEMVPIPSTSGRFSTKILPDPEKVDDLRYRIGKILEK